MTQSGFRDAKPLVAPVYKAGLVLLRVNARGETEICLTQVKAQNPAEQHLVDYGLPKGTRMYRDADGTWQDARDPFTAHEHRSTLESLKETLARECEEEIGLPASLCRKAEISELGLRLFASRDPKKGAFEIMWYAAEATPEMIDNMGEPEQARSARWFTLAEINTMHTQGHINPHYVRVIAEAVHQYYAKALTPTRFAEPTPLEPAPPTR